MNIGTILKKTSRELKIAGSPTPNIDARLLLKFTLEKTREYLTAHTCEPLTNSDYARFRRVIRRRKKGEPIAYITKEKEFFGYDFYVNKNVLIPRPESEMLVENSLSFLESRIKPCLPAGRNQELRKKLPTTHYPLLSILDIGTGSGNVIISLALETKKLPPFGRGLAKKTERSYCLMPIFNASDISKKALYVARKNTKKHGVSKNIRFFQSDLFSNSTMPKKYDVIIANLPYVPKNSKEQKMAVDHLESNKRSCELSKSKWKNPILYEPKSSIFAKDSGMKIIKKFIDQAKKRINDKGLILIEADPRNIKKLSIYAKKLFDDSKIKIIKDLSGQKRMLKVLT